MEDMICVKCGEDLVSCPFCEKLFCIHCWWKEEDVFDGKEEGDRT